MCKYDENRSSNPRDYEGNISIFRWFFDALVLSKLRYAICAWSGFLSAELEGQINAFLKRAFKYGFCTKI